MTLSFEIPCVPPKATSQMKRAVRLPNGIRFFKGKAVENAETMLLTLLASYRPSQPFIGAIALEVRWRYPWRKSEQKSVIALGVAPCDTRPDCDNCAKLLIDSMTKLLFWKNDAQVATLTVQKQWGDNPGIAIRITSLDAEAAK